MLEFRTVFIMKYTGKSVGKAAIKRERAARTSRIPQPYATSLRERANNPSNSGSSLDCCETTAHGRAVEIESIAEKETRGADGRFRATPRDFLGSLPAS
jgi:hypothetical protein